MTQHMQQDGFRDHPVAFGTARARDGEVARHFRVIKQAVNSGLQGDDQPQVGKARIEARRLLGEQRNFDVAQIGCIRIGTEIFSRKGCAQRVYPPLGRSDGGR